MQYSVRFFALFACVLLLAGCRNTDTHEEMAPEHDQNVEIASSQEARQLADQRVTGNESCDNYLETIQCLANQSAIGHQFSELYDSLRISLENVPNEQLDAYCTNLADALVAHPTYFIDYAQCNKIQPDQERMDAMRISEQLTEQGAETLTVQENTL